MKGKKVQLASLQSIGRSHQHEIVTVQRSDRWEIYHRLQALEIPCQCSTNKPLSVKVDTIYRAIQLWSVAKQLTAPNDELVHWLNRCWWMNSP